MVLDQTEFFHRNTDTVCDHRHMQMDTDGFGMNGNHAVFINISISAVRLQMEMRLTGTVALNFYHIRCTVKVKIRSFDTICLIVGIRCSGMNLNCILCHGFRSTHICRQNLKLNLNRIGSSSCMCFRICSNDGNGITKLEYFFITEYRTVPSITFIVQRQHDKTVDSVLATCSYNVFRSDNLKYARHLFCF